MYNFHFLCGRPVRSRTFFSKVMRTESFNPNKIKCKLLYQQFLSSPTRSTEQQKQTSSKQSKILEYWCSVRQYKQSRALAELQQLEVQFRLSAAYSAHADPHGVSSSCGGVGCHVSWNSKGMSQMRARPTRKLGEPSDRRYTAVPASLSRASWCNLLFLRVDCAHLVLTTGSDILGYVGPWAKCLQQPLISDWLIVEPLVWFRRLEIKNNNIDPFIFS